MLDVGMIPFARFFPEEAGAETRVVMILGHRTLPDDEYGLLESYCTDPQCDCRRVMLNVVARRARAIWATISFGFDRDGEMAGPFADPFNPQSEHTDALLRIVREVLDDPDYVLRLEQHYHQFKQAAADPTHPVQAVLADIARAQAKASRSSKARTRATSNSSKPERRRKRAAQPSEESIPTATRP